jgi:hypothetical protein
VTFDVYIKTLLSNTDNNDYVKMESNMTGVTASQPLKEAERKFEVGIMVPSTKVTVRGKDEFKQHQEESMYGGAFTANITELTENNGDIARQIGSNDLVDSFIMTPEYKKSYIKVQDLHTLVRGESTAVFNLNRYKTLFLQAHKQEILSKKPNISAQEIATFTNYYWQQYLEGPKKFNGTEEEYDARFPKSAENGFKHYAFDRIKNYETLINWFADFIKANPEFKNLGAIAGPGNYFNVDKYGLNESCNRALVGEAFALALKDSSFIGVCGSEQSFLYALGLETVGPIKQHNFDTPELKLATSLTVGGTIVDSVSRANPDMSEACMKDIVAEIVRLHSGTEINATDLNTIIDKTKSEIAAIYAEIHSQSNLPSDFLEALATRLDVSAIQVLLNATQQHFDWQASSLLNDNINELKSLVNHALLYSNTMHTMAIKVSANNVSLLKEHDMVISAVSAAVHKDDEDLDIHKYLNKLSQESEKLAAKRPLMHGVAQYATIDDILAAHEALKASKDWSGKNIGLIVKAAESQIKNNYQKNSAVNLVLQGHPEIESGGNFNHPLLIGALASSKHHYLVTAPIKKLLSIYNQAEIIRKITPNYKINTGLQTTMNDLMVHLENNAASLNQGQQDLLTEIVGKYGAKIIA